MESESFPIVEPFTNSQQRVVKRLMSVWTASLEESRIQKLGMVHESFVERLGSISAE
jgi:hypothetical protein